MMYKVWTKSVCQATVLNKNGKAIVINAPRGFVEDGNNAETWASAIDNAHTELVENGDFYESVARDYTSIRKLETVYLFADGLVNWKSADGKAGTAMNPACADIIGYLARNEEIDKNRLRPLLNAWIISIYNESELDLDASAITLTGKRIDEFIARMGKDKVSNRLTGNKTMVSGNRETIWKSKSAFMRELCRWTVSVTQMKYTIVPRIEIRDN